MKPWEIDDIRRAVKGKWLMRGEYLRAFNGRICTDSRKAAEGELFIAIKGERFDAHDFVPEVVAKDVAAVLVHRELAADTLLLARDHRVAVIQVDDTIAGLNRLAAAYRRNELGGGFRARVIAVGGSNGKTTTKRIIHALLEEKFGPQGGVASPKSFNNNIGMPLTLLEVMPGHDYVVLEIGTNAPGEIKALAEVCRPDVAVITSIGMEHLEKLTDLAGVAREEAAVAEYVAEGGLLIVPDVPELLRELPLARVPRLVIATETRSAKAPAGGDASQLILTDVREAMDGTRFSINGRGEFFVPLLGGHNAMNALMAIAVARRMGVSDDQIVAGLRKVAPAPGRFEPLTIGPWRVINDAYNANPTSVEAALRTFAALPAGGRRVVVLGDMLELGAAGEAAHRQIGRQVARSAFDVFVAIGPAMQAAAEEARNEARARGAKAVPRVVWFESTAAAREGLVWLLEAGDSLLLKGSHGMALESLLEVLRSGIDSRSLDGAAPRRP